MKQFVMRMLREKYHIPVRELAIAAGVSQQFISDMELGKYNDRYAYRKRGEPLLFGAFLSVAAARERQAKRLIEDLTNNQNRLFEYVEDMEDMEDMEDTKKHEL